MIAVDAARWLFPFGWAYTNVLGNLVASAVCFAAGGVWAHRKIVRPMVEHHRSVHERLDRIEAKR